MNFSCTKNCVEPHWFTLKLVKHEKENLKWLADHSKLQSGPKSKQKIGWYNERRVTEPLDDPNLWYYDCAPLQSRDACSCQIPFMLDCHNLTMPSLPVDAKVIPPMSHSSCQTYTSENQEDQFSKCRNCSLSNDSLQIATVKHLGTGRQQKQLMRFNNTKPRIQHGINALGLSNRKYRQQRVFTKLQENNWKYDVILPGIKVYVQDKSVRVQILSWYHVSKPLRNWEWPKKLAGK